jgi:hypothetical protein
VDITNLLSHYLDQGVDEEELRQIALAALARRLRELKLAVGEAVVRAQGELLLGCMGGMDQALHQARMLGKEHRCLYRQWRELYQRGAHHHCAGVTADPKGGEG